MVTETEYELLGDFVGNIYSSDCESVEESDELSEDQSDADSDK